MMIKYAQSLHAVNRGATSAEEQVESYERMMMRALFDIVQNDIPHVFLDFRMMRVYV